MVLATIDIKGVPTKVAMQANKNGFLYVLDRTTGKLVAANPFVKVNWASGIDLETGKPIYTEVSKKARAGEKVTVWPSTLGGKNWGPMSFNPQTDTMYANTLNIGWHYKAVPRSTKPANSTSASTCPTFGNVPTAHAAISKPSIR